MATRGPELRPRNTPHVLYNILCRVFCILHYKKKCISCSVGVRKFSGNLAHEILGSGHVQEIWYKHILGIENDQEI